MLPAKRFIIFNSNKKFWCNHYHQLTQLTNQKTLPSQFLAIDKIFWQEVSRRHY